MSHVTQCLPQWWLQEDNDALARQRPSPRSMSSRVFVLILQQDYPSPLGYFDFAGRRVGQILDVFLMTYPKGT